MAKRRKGIGLSGLIFTQRSIAIDNLGIPWVIDPAKGTVGLINAITEPKKPAVKKRK